MEVLMSHYHNSFFKFKSWNPRCLIQDKALDGLQLEFRDIHQEQKHFLLGNQVEIRRL